MLEPATLCPQASWGVLNPQQLGMTPQHRRLSASTNPNYPGSDGGNSPGRHASPKPGAGIHTSPGRGTTSGRAIHSNDASSTPRRDRVSSGSVSSEEGTPGSFDTFLARFGFGLPRGAGASPGVPSNVPFSTPNRSKAPASKAPPSGCSGYFEYPSGGARGGGTARGALRGAAGVAAAAGSPAAERGAREAGAGGTAGTAAAAAAADAGDAGDGDGGSAADELGRRMERLRVMVLGWVNRDG